TRVMDTRTTGLAVASNGVASAPTESEAVAAQFNVTVVDPVEPGFLTAWPCAGDRPVASNVNFVAGEVAANGATVAAAAGRVCLGTSVQAHLVVDATGLWIAAA